MKKELILLAIALLGLLSCNNDDEQPKGDVNVQVLLNGFEPAQNVDVYTNPPSIQGKTDAFGSVLLTDLDVGSYEVFASVNNFGSGKSVINIQADRLAQTTIGIIAGVNVGLAPTITVILPSMPAEFSENEEIIFSADVFDDETPNQDIKVTWASNIDGVINTSSPSANGNISFSTSSLSRGLHDITVTAEDADGYTASASIEVSTFSPGQITLLEPTKSEGKVLLEWSEYPNSDFSQYEIYRTDGNCTDQGQVLLTTISDKGTTSYTDELPPFEFQVCYFVRGVNTENYSRNSNQELVDSPSGPVFNFQPYDLLVHPTNNYAYVLDQNGQKLIKFDYINLEVVGEINLQGTIGYCDIGDNGFGVEIYAPSSDGSIYVYDADDLSLTTSINTGLATASVVINGLGHVIASVQPSPWWEQPVRTYLRSNGTQIDGNGDHDRDRLRMIPGKNEIISISTGISPTDMEYFDLSEDGSFELHEDDDYHGDYPLNARIFRVSDDGTYSITSSRGAVYLANSSMEYKGELEQGSLDYSDFAFSDDGSIIYAATSNRKSIQLGNYPSLIRDGEILTKGFPVLIVRNGDKIISLSQSSEFSFNMGIEIIEL